MLRWTSGILVILLASSGCRSGARWCPSETAVCDTPSQFLAWNETTRRELVPDFTQLPDTKDAREPSSSTLMNLTEDEAQCSAAANSSLANLLDREATAISQTQSRHLAATATTIAEILRLEAGDQRNRSAASALKLLLRLGEAEMGATTLSQSLVEVQALHDDVQAMLANQLLSPISRGDVESQRLDLEYRQIENEQTITRLNNDLSQLLRVELAPGTRWWPDVSLVVSSELPDRDLAVQTALHHRADLLALRAATNAGDPTATATLLRSVNPALGISKLGCCCLLLQFAGPSCCEADSRDGQVRQLLKEREEAATRETLAAIDLIEQRLALIQVTRQRSEIVNSNVVGAEKQAAIAPEATIKVRQAKLEVLKVRQALLHDVIEWRLAQVQLRETQGILAVECGFSPECR